MKTERILLVLFFLIAFGLAIYQTIHFTPMDRISPLVVAIPCFLLLGLILYDEIKTLQKTKNFDEKTIALHHTRQRELITLLWIFGLVVGIYLVGFTVALPAFIFLMLKVNGNESWRVAILVTLGVTVVLYFFFVSFLKLNLYSGILLN